MTVAATNDGTNITNLQVTPAHLCAANYSDTPTTNCVTTTAIEYVRVNTRVTVASLFNSYGFGGNYTLHGQALERVRQ